MADGEKTRMENLKLFAVAEAEGASQAIREFEDDSLSEWCEERGLFTDRAIGGYLRAMKMMVAQIESQMAMVRITNDAGAQ